MVSLGEASASPDATDAAGNSITHTDEQESGAGSVLTLEDLPVQPGIGAPLTLRGQEEGDESILSTAKQHAIVT